MKVLNLIIAVILSFALLSCSSNSALEPSSAQTSTLDKNVSQVESVDFGPGLLHDNGIFAVLNVTEEQKTQIHDLVKAKLEELRPKERPQQRPSKEERQAKREEMRKAIEQIIMTVLTPEQQNKFTILKTQLDSGKMPEELIDYRIAKLDEKLNLTDEQKTQIKVLDTWDKLVQARNTMQENPGEARGQMKDISQQHEQQILNILTPDQKIVFEQMKTERRKHRRGKMQRFGQRNAEQRFQHLVEALNLDESQQAKLQEIFTNLKQNRPDNFQDLSPEERHHLMQQRMAEIDAQIKSILTPEQIELFEALKAERGPKGGHRWFGRNN